MEILGQDVETQIGGEDEGIEEVAAQEKYGRKTAQMENVDLTSMEVSPLREHLD